MLYESCVKSGIPESLYYQYLLPSGNQPFSVAFGVPDSIILSHTHLLWNKKLIKKSCRCFFQIETPEHVVDIEINMKNDLSQLNLIRIHQSGFPRNTKEILFKKSYEIFGRCHQGEVSTICPENKPSWWLNQPFWKIFVKMDIFPIFRGEKKSLKPPPRNINSIHCSFLNHCHGYHFLQHQRHMALVH